jgi:hypothetical protein
MIWDWAEGKPLQTGPAAAGDATAPSITEALFRVSVNPLLGLVGVELLD